MRGFLAAAAALAASITSGCAGGPGSPVPPPMPRAPLVGDLRFQQVDSPQMNNGYYNGGAGSGIMLSGGGYSFSEATGAPLGVDGCYPDPATPPLSQDCGWVFQAYNLPNSVTGLSAYYLSVYYSDFQKEMALLSNPTTVVTGWDVNPDYGIVALSYMVTQQTTGFDMAMHTVALAQMQAAATQEGLLGRVITAVSFNAGQISYLSYGWTKDKGTVYETTVATSTKATAWPAVQQLAAQGYIITAIGGNNANGVIIVGTKVKGDTLPRKVGAILPGTGNASEDTSGVIDGAMVADIFDETTKQGFVARIFEQ